MIRLILCSIILTTAVIASSAQSPGQTPPATKPSAAKHAPNRDSVLLFDGKTLQGWKVVQDFDFARHGKVAVKEGAIELAAGQPGTAIAWQRKFPRENYEVSLEAMRYDGDDFFCGMTFPVGKEYCTLIIGGWGGTMIGLSNIDGQPADENETTQAERFTKNKWYRIRLRVTTAAIEVWLENESIIKVERKDREFSIWWEQEPVRPFGIASWRTGARLRKIRLKKIKSEG